MADMAVSSKGARVGAFFAAPAFVYILLVTIYPLLYALWASFTDLRLTRPLTKFVGFETYGRALSDPVFLNALVVTTIFLVAVISLEFLLGFAMALSFRAMKKSRPTLRALLMLPVMATPVSVGLVWKLMLNSDFGILAHLGTVLGIGVVPWLSNPTLAVVSIIVMDVWQWTPFMFLILLAGLESMPSELYEAAEIDGAHRAQTLWWVTLPLMSRIIVIAILFRFMFAVATFDSVFVLTKGGPARATDLITLYLQREGLVNLNIASASAVSILILIPVFIVTSAIYKKGFARAY